jgi:RNA polymerase sigma factor (sigma-70 family)
MCKLTPLPETAEEFITTCMGLVTHIARAWCRRWNGFIIDESELKQVIIVDLIERWGERPTEPDAAAKWIYRKINNAAQRTVRRVFRYRRRIELVPPDIPLEIMARCDRVSETVEEVLLHERIGGLRQELERLPPTLRIVAERMFGLDGQPAASTIRQTAQQLGLTQGVVSERLRSALNTLRVRLDETDAN